MKCKWLLAGAFAFLTSTLGLNTSAGVMVEAASLHTVRFTWDIIPSAVDYEFVLLSGEEDTKENVVRRWREFFTNGLTLDLSAYSNLAEEGLYWKVCALDFHGNYIGHFSKPVSIDEDSTFNPAAPLTTTEFEDMDYFPLYPVYSWIPQAGARRHQVQVYRMESGGDVCVRDFYGDDNDVYDWESYTIPGRYYWRVRSCNDEGRATSEWSDASYFYIETPTPIAALGDSITHGGGAVSVPQGYLLYDWETYSPVPVKNLGLSGNTTAEMLERFEDDVLPWQPRVLVIMGGVNDFRAGITGSETVSNLTEIRDKCDAYGIIPVFVTPTPIRPDYMVHRIAGIEVPPSDWLVHFNYINHWVKGQRFHVDVASALQDEEGNLRGNYTTDGLHPDYYGKKYIGENIGRYLEANFAWLTNDLDKKPIPLP